MKTIKEIADALNAAITSQRDNFSLPQEEVDAAFDDAFALIVELMAIEREFPGLREGLARASEKMLGTPQPAASVYETRGFIEL